MKFTIRNSPYTSYFDRNLIRKNAPTESCCCASDSAGDLAGDSVGLKLSSRNYKIRFLN